MSAPYSDYQLALGAPWLQGPNGTAWLSGHGVMKDAFVEATIQAVKCRFISVCPVDALQYIGQERLLEQYPNENLYQYRARLQSAWDLWQYAGTKQGVLAAIHGLGFSNVTILENSDWAVPPSQGYGPGDEWWRFWVIIDQPHGLSPNWAWGDGSLWGRPTFGLSGGGAQALPPIISNIKKWRPAHAQCVALIIILSGRLWGNGWNWGDGSTWGGKAAYTIA